MITKKELEQLLNAMETERIEKTRSISDDDKFGEAICSFSNDFPDTKLPGYLLIGVTNEGKRGGITIDENTIQKFLHFRTNGNILPSPVLIIEKFQFDDGEVLVVEVMPSQLPPVRYKQKVCIRIGPRKGVANEQEEKILTEKRISFAKTYDLEPCLGSSLQDISLDIFKLQYLPYAIDRETLENNHRDLKLQLASLKLYDLQNDMPTNAALLLFGTNPRFFIEGAKIQYVKFEGEDETSNFINEVSFEGDFVTQLRELNVFIKNNIIKEKFNGIGEGYSYNYPLRAITELIYNAVIHNDYRTNAPIKFYEYADKLVITNSGGLYGNARPDNFPNVNDYRNPVLAEAAKILGYVNKFNVGVKNAEKALKDNGNLPPEFIKDNPYYFQVTIYSK